MMPADYTNFLVASTQASAALIGLLFVSVSIAPERVFGAQAEARRQSLAVSAFIALANVFFISFGGLVPNFYFGVMVIVAGALAESQSLALLVLWREWRREHILVRSLALFALSAGIYGAEIVIGVHLLSHTTDTGAVTSLFGLLLGAYAIGLSRAWELLGAPHGRSRVFTGFLGYLRHRMGASDPTHKIESRPATPAEPDKRA